MDREKRTRKLCRIGQTIRLLWSTVCHEFIVCQNSPLWVLVVLFTGFIWRVHFSGTFQVLIRWFYLEWFACFLTITGKSHCFIPMSHNCGRVWKVKRSSVPDKDKPAWKGKKKTLRQQWRQLTHKAEPLPAATEKKKKRTEKRRRKKSPVAVHSASPIVWMLYCNAIN